MPPGELLRFVPGRVALQGGGEAVSKGEQTNRWHVLAALWLLACGQLDNNFAGMGIWKNRWRRSSMIQEMPPLPHSQQSRLAQSITAQLASNVQPAANPTIVSRPSQLSPHKACQRLAPKAISKEKPKPTRRRDNEPSRPWPKCWVRPRSSMWRC